MGQAANRDEQDILPAEMNRTLARKVLRILREATEGDDVGHSEDQLAAVVARLAPRQLHEVLGLSLPALAMLGQTELAVSVQKSLANRMGAADGA